MRYIKLIAKPNTWYKAGSEVLWEGLKEDGWTMRRPNEGEWEYVIKPDHGIGCVGIRAAQFDGLVQIAAEYEDGEWCLLDEFEVEIVDHDKRNLP